MSEQLYEQISAFVDGELPEHETELLLRRLEREPELRAALVRYTAIGANLRETAARGASRSFTARVSAAIAAEGVKRPVLRVGATTRWLRPVAGLALAAAVAAVAIVGVQQFQDPAATSPISPTQMADVAAVPMPAATSPVVIGEPVDDSYTVPAPARNMPIVPAARLTNYVVAHSQYSSTLGRRNVLSGIIAEDPTPLDETGAPLPPAATKP